MSHAMPVPNPLQNVSITRHWEAVTPVVIIRDILALVAASMPGLMTIGRVDDNAEPVAEVIINDMRAGTALDIVCDKYGGEIWISTRYRPDIPETVRFQVSYLNPGRPTIHAAQAAPEASGGFIPEKWANKSGRPTPETTSQKGKNHARSRQQPE